MRRLRAEPTSRRRPLRGGRARASYNQVTLVRFVNGFWCCGSSICMGGIMPMARWGRAVLYSFID
ncbi:hypothetical protein, partial [Porphyromonas sp.]|uniref:hypothetical protein n=1 Tax=Porphyromonas sp. TaxID=1924944 RepID=UPI002A760F9A